MTSIWRMGTAVLALAAAVFHLWYAATMPFFSPIAAYFALSGFLFLLGATFILFNGSEIIFKVGAAGLLTLSAIDNALLYYTRTFGLRFLFFFIRSFRPSALNGTLSNGTLPRPQFSGTFSGPPPNGGTPWSTSWFPPGAVQFFVLQSLIIAVAAIALWRAHRAMKGSTAANRENPKHDRVAVP